MVKTYEKFNSKLGEKYWENFVKRDIKFYDSISKILKKHLVKKSNIDGLDVGAGPGMGAWILDRLEIKGKLYSVEPSENYKEGEKFADSLLKSKSKLIYLPKKGEMSESINIFNLKSESLDYILFLRAAHEIMLSYKNYKNFANDFQKVCNLVKKGGIIVLADPQYSEFVNDNPKKYFYVIREIRKYKEKTLGHSHIPEDYLTLKKLKNVIPKDFKLVGKIEIENTKDLEFLKSKGFNLKKSPTKFYVVCYKRR